jgi:Alkylated DNA repair protein
METMIEHPIIKGLYYFPNILFEKEDLDLIKSLDEKKWTSVGGKNSRVVQQYGYNYDYKIKSANTKNKAESMPIEIENLGKKLEEICKKIGIIDDKYKFDQCIVNNYQPGQGISKHIDSKQFGRVIGCYSIGGTVQMKFIKGKEIVDVTIEKGSLYIMSGDARYKWMHELPSRLFDEINLKKKERERRISITFRNMN